MLAIREMNHPEIERIREIDRSETIRQEYVLDDGELRLKEVYWEVPPWFDDGRPEHSIQEKIEAWQPILEAGGTMWGAFDGERLVALAIYRPNLTEDMAQLAVLHVSKSFRGKGVGSALAEEVFKKARKDGASRIYVSSSPSKATIHFYMRHGFRLAKKVINELHELEPEDIHMVKPLG